MSLRPNAPAALAFFVVAVCWLGFGAILILGKRAAAKVERRRDIWSHSGFLLQCLAYAICFSFFRPYFSPIVSMPNPAEGIMAALIMAIAIASGWLCFSAARTLGKQWALVARIIEDHELVTQGVYGIVRNPIYLAMFGMLIATGLAISHWQALVAASTVFLCGNQIRIRSEERLLRETFGKQFDDYARRVPAFFPRII
jgi:protein-S-isoprenylcysteine O-methyltransferase Ste14